MIPQYVWYCTIILRKNNKSLLSFQHLKWFKEDHWKAIALLKWAMWNLSDKVTEELKELVNTDKKVGKDTKYYLEEFDKRFRILLSK